MRIVPITFHETLCRPPTLILIIVFFDDLMNSNVEAIFETKRLNSNQATETK